MSGRDEHGVTRREFVQAGMAGAALLATPGMLHAAGRDSDKAAVLAQVPRMHAENLKRLQDWIALPSIAAQGLNYPAGAEYMARLATAAGFTGVRLVPTSGKPGVFGRLDAGARTTVGVYFMYDVKHFAPEEWSSPPLEARLVEKPGLGTVCMGRGAVNQKGPQNSFLSALAAFRAAGRRLPVNLVLVCEGEEEIASPHFLEVVREPGVYAALRECTGVFMPEAGQDRDGGVQVSLGAKGVVELELVSSGEAWHRGPKHDVHSSLEASLDSPSWHLVQALNTLVEKDGHTPAVEGFFEKVRPLSDAQRRMILDHVAKTPEDSMKQSLGVEHWVHDESWADAMLRLESRPTINIEGLVGGYTGPGGKTVLPHRAVAKIDMRLVPDQKPEDIARKLRRHLDEQGFADIEISPSQHFLVPSRTPIDHPAVAIICDALRETYESEPIVFPNIGGAGPNYIFTDTLKQPCFVVPHATHDQANHAPNENMEVEGFFRGIRTQCRVFESLATLRP